MCNKKGEITLKLWIDDCRPAPEGEGYITCKRVDFAKKLIIAWEKGQISNNPIEQKEMLEAFGSTIELIDIDHDAGEYAQYGGDYIKLLDWLEETGRNYPIRIHSMNPIGVANMRRIIERNGWKEIR